MSVSRNSSMRALKQLSSSGRQVRQLHMTGASPASRLLTTDKAAAARLPRDLAGLQAECMRRDLVWVGTEAELVERITLDNTRSMSTVAGSKRPSLASQSVKQGREINTSRVLKAPKDTSTIDFAFLPDTETVITVDDIRVPIVDTDSALSRSGVNPHLVEDQPVFKPIIATAAGDVAPSPMADVHDNSAAHVDFHAVTDALRGGAQSIASSTKAQEAGSTIQHLWNGVMDDVFGARKPNVAA